VRIAIDAGTLRVEVTDDGVGGADPAAGTGLRGLADRVQILGGNLEVTSPLSEGTRITARIPLDAR
jgi:signal transduction histidine kinase